MIRDGPRGRRSCAPFILEVGLLHLRGLKTSGGAGRVSLEVISPRRWGHGVRLLRATDVSG